MAFNWQSIMLNTRKYTNKIVIYYFSENTVLYISIIVFYYIFICFRCKRQNNVTVDVHLYGLTFSYWIMVKQ